ncbi:hypothetical protein CTA2_4509 [Colletotrichum tanaceti]|uniref:Uncharacterized protein n=1 Tax=Colletotrichum tanaceti TaxID=1306861 RepID=A0A4V6DFP1_9PEZI|nr:hypothetical protein CTA2_4509 [Colletotrichum tanaceti]TKW49816.1 hypothetical protein CTA1_10867 [Colletotrichum tanaceti]
MICQAMIDDLKADPVRWEAESQKQAPSIDGDSELSAQPAKPVRLLGNKAPSDFNSELPDQVIYVEPLLPFVDPAAADHTDLPFDLAIGSTTDLDTAYLAPGSADSFVSPPSFARDIDATRPCMTRPSNPSTSGASYPSPSAPSILHRDASLVRGSRASAAETPAATASNSDDPDTRAEILITDIYTQMGHYAM